MPKINEEFVWGGDWEGNLNRKKILKGVLKIQFDSNLNILETNKQMKSSPTSMYPWARAAKRYEE